VAGVPPDYFTATGQLWGNPVYDWNAVETDNYSFWIRRIRHSFKLYDTLRIDHFRGFESFWEVPAGSVDAVNGRWIKGPGINLFNRIREELGDLDIIAEDLGFQTDQVVKLINDTGFPGMKILQFAFDPEGDSDYLPHNHERNSVVYTGTHDNKTVRDWIDTAPEKERKFAIKYLKLDDREEGYNWGLIRGAWCSGAYLAIAQMQDFLDLGEESRMNTPATLGENWTWRVKKSDLNQKLSKRIADLTRTYRRG
jgi:4-alpha-glucanotransferase